MRGRDRDAPTPIRLEHAARAVGAPKRAPPPWVGLPGVGPQITTKGGKGATRGTALYASERTMPCSCTTRENAGKVHRTSAKPFPQFADGGSGFRVSPGQLLAQLPSALAALARGEHCPRVSEQAR